MGFIFLCEYSPEIHNDNSILKSDLEKEADKIFTSDSIFDIVSIKEEYENMVLRYRRIDE